MSSDRLLHRSLSQGFGGRADLDRAGCVLVCAGVCGRVCLCDGGYSLWLDPWWDHEVSVVPGFLGRQAVSLENFLCIKYKCITNFLAGWDNPPNLKERWREKTEKEEDDRRRAREGTEEGKVEVEEREERGFSSGRLEGIEGRK